MKARYVSIVLLNWNGNKYVFECIKSIKDQTYEKFDLIIVDNNSTDGSREEIKKQYPKNIFIDNEENYGFSKGMNIGINAANGEFILLLNNDVFLKEDFIEKCVTKLNESKEYDSVQGSAYHWINGELTNDIQTGALFLKKRLQGFSYPCSEPVESFGPNGSFMFLRKSALDDVIKKSGYPFDEDFETGWEDMDLWFRLQLFGHKCIYVPDSVVWHVGSASAKERKRLIDKDLEYQKRIFRNRYYVIKKNYTKTMKRKYFFALLFTELILYPYYFFKSFKSLKALKAAKKEVRKNKIKIKGKRDLIQKNKIVDNSYIKRFFVKF